MTSEQSVHVHDRVEEVTEHLALLLCVCVDLPLVTAELYRLLIYLFFDILKEERKLLLVDLEAATIVMEFYEVLLLDFGPMDIF